MVAEGTDHLTVIVSLTDRGKTQVVILESLRVKDVHLVQVAENVLILEASIRDHLQERVMTRAVSAVLTQVVVKAFKIKSPQQSLALQGSTHSYKKSRL